MARDVSRRAAVLGGLAAARMQPVSAQVGPKLLTELGPTMEEAAGLLARLVAAQDIVGGVAGVTDRSGRRIATAGTSGDRALDGDTVFEIGSITKVFTAMLLAEMAGRGELAPTDPVATYLPPEGRPRAYDNRPITLLDLATHTSGLPRRPGNFRPGDPANPYADYTVAQMYEFVSSIPPLTYPGAQYLYSNLGFALLGQALALRAGRPFEELVVARLCQPLGLDSTRITLSPDMRARLAPGHDEALQATPGWDLPSFAGAGALRSTPNDMMRLAECCLGRQASPIQPWLATMLAVRRQTDQAGIVAASGWFVRTGHADEIVLKDGDTGGYSSVVGYSTRTGIGCAVLANTSAGIAVPRLGTHLINRDFPGPAAHPAYAIDPAKLPGLAGRYEVLPGFVLTVRPEGGRLMVQATNQAAYPVFPDSDTEFTFRVVAARLRFEVGADGQAIAATLYQNGRAMRGTRLPL